jgi:hypothetical protein
MVASVLELKDHGDNHREQEKWIAIMNVREKSQLMNVSALVRLDAPFRWSVWQ